MPNWVNNRIHFEDEDGCMRARALMQTSDETAFDFNAVLPMPEELQIDSGSCTRDALLWLRSDRGERVDGLSEGDVAQLEAIRGKLESGGWRSPGGDALDSNALYALGERYQSNEERYGAPTWYEWRCEHWGTKWNAGNVAWDETSVSFDTAWGDVTEIVRELCVRIGASAYYSWSDEDFGANVGESVVFGRTREAIVGEVADFSSHAYVLAAEKWDPDGELFRYDLERGEIVYESDVGRFHDPHLLCGDVFTTPLRKAWDAGKRGLHEFDACMEVSR